MYFSSSCCKLFLFYFKSFILFNQTKLKNTEDKSLALKDDIKNVIQLQLRFI